MRHAVHTERLNIAIPPVLLAAIRAKANDDGMTINEMVRVALRQAVGGRRRA